MRPPLTLSGFGRLEGKMGEGMRSQHKGKIVEYIEPADDRQYVVIHFTDGTKFEIEIKGRKIPYLDWND